MAFNPLLLHPIKALHLYHAQLSGCSARVRIAAHLKRIASADAPLSDAAATTPPLIYHTLDFRTKQQRAPDYLALNPNAAVPALIVEFDDSRSSAAATTTTTDDDNRSAAPSLTSPDPPKPNTAVLTQSLAILDLLDTLFPAPLLLPAAPAPPLPRSALPPGAPNARGSVFATAADAAPHDAWSGVCRRARVLELAALVACDVQPAGSTRVREQLAQDFGADGARWARWVYARGLGVYEQLLAEEGESGVRKGRFSVGDEVSWADVCLVPAVQGALRVGLGVEEWPRVREVVEECWALEAFRKGGLGGHGRLVP